MTVLQASTVLSFLPAAVWAAACGKHCVAAVVATNALTSAVVHRRRRPGADLSDTADRLAIAAWVAANATVAAGAPVIAAVAVAAVVVLNHWRLQLSVGCSRRVAIHAAMHVAGALGTAALCCP